jgi:LPS sulfotransferase NodH
VDVGIAVIDRPAFIIGCARSGTSILGEAVAAHPRAIYLFEASDVWSGVIGERPDHRLREEDATPSVVAAVRHELLEAAHEAARETGRHPHDAVLVEKNPKHVIRIPFLNAVFPDARFLHIVRDGRDVTASLMFRNRGERWGHLETPGWRELLARFPTQNHIRCAHQWRDAMAIARHDVVALGLKPDRYLEVRYEDLVRDPKPVIARVLALLGLPDAAEVDAFLPRIQDETAGSYHAKKQVRHYVEDHSRRVGRHEENFTPEELAEVEVVCRDMLRELGYSKRS